VLTIGDLGARRFGDVGLDAMGCPTTPVLVVDLTTPADDIAGAVHTVEAIGGRSTVVVGVADTVRPAVEPLVETIDLTLSEVADDDRRVVIATVDRALAAIERVLAASPRAAVVLGGLLRLTSALPVEAGLLAESLAYSTLQAGPEFSAWRASRPRRAVPDAERPPVRSTREGSTLTVHLSHPERHNAFSTRMRDALTEALTVADLDPSIGRVELRADGPSFCSGGDLDEFGTAPDPVGAHLVRTNRSVAALLHRLRDRMHVHVHGACIGAGVELPAFASRVSAQPGSYFALPEVTMGLVPGAGGTVSIARRVGRWRTAHLALTGDRIDAATALRWGLVDEVVGP
jgi:hypothetical protein